MKFDRYKMQAYFPLLKASSQNTLEYNQVADVPSVGVSKRACHVGEDLNKKSLTYTCDCDIIIERLEKGDKLNIAEWSSSVARRAHNPKVVGSNPASATSREPRHASCVRGFFVCEIFVLAAEDAAIS